MDVKLFACRHDDDDWQETMDQIMAKAAWPHRYAQAMPAPEEGCNVALGEPYEVSPGVTRLFFAYVAKSEDVLTDFELDVELAVRQIEGRVSGLFTSEDGTRKVIQVELPTEIKDAFIAVLAPAPQEISIPLENY